MAWCQSHDVQLANAGSEPPEARCTAVVTQSPATQQLLRHTGFPKSRQCLPGRLMNLPWSSRPDRARHTQYEVGSYYSYKWSYISPVNVTGVITLLIGAPQLHLYLVTGPSLKFSRVHRPLDEERLCIEELSKLPNLGGFKMPNSAEWWVVGGGWWCWVVGGGGTPCFLLQCTSFFGHN